MLQEMIFLLSKLLHSLIFPFALAVFLVTAYLIILSRKEIWAFLCMPKKHYLSLLIIIFVISLSIRFYADKSHMMYVDEYMYMETGKNIIQDASIGDYQKSIGWPMLISFTFGILGIGNFNAIYLSCLIGALTVILFFYIAYLITKKESISLITAILLAISPLHIFWGGTAETNVASLFFISLSILGYLFYLKKQDTVLLWLFSSLLALAAIFRPENYILFFVFGLHYFFFFRKRKNRLRIILPFFFALIVALPNLIGIIHFYSAENQVETVTEGMISEPNWSFGNIVKNSFNYGLELFVNSYHPLLFSLFLFAGIVLSFFIIRKYFYFMLLYLGLFWVVYSASWLDVLGGGERILITFFVPLYFFAAYGIDNFSSYIAQKLNIKNKWNILLPLFFLLVITFLPLVLKSLEKDQSNLLEAEIIEKAETLYAENYIVVSAYPEVLRATTEIDTKSIDEFIEKEGFYLSDKNNQRILFFDDYSCSRIPISDIIDKCSYMRENFDLEKDHIFEKEGVVYGFYEITGEK